MSSEDESANTPSMHTLQTKKRYNKIYNHFQNWKKLKGATSISQNVLMDYFSDVAKTTKPTTLWAYYSMLKATLKTNDDIDITSWSKLNEFIKRKNAGFKPSRSKVFTDEEIEKFVNEASDEEWLDVKVVCIFGVKGVHRINKLINVKVEHIKQYDDMFLVNIPKAVTGAIDTFTITGTFFRIIQKYLAIRPENAKDNRLFVHCLDGVNPRVKHLHKGIPIGKTKFYEMPRKMAKFLKLPEPERYTGFSFRRASDNLKSSTGGYNSISGIQQYSTNEPDEDSEVSLDYETGQLETSPVGCKRMSSSAAGSINGNTTGHVCTIGCGQVKCAMEENERSVLHAFSIMKASDYVITEVIPAQFASDPNCRWLVAYTHITEPVSSFNADETFEDITRSIPNNVRVVQKYITRKSSQHLAAYIVEYGVNCKCRKQSSDIFSFSVNEI